MLSDALINPPTGNQLMSFLGCAALILFFYNEIRRLREAGKPTKIKTPLEIKNAAVFITRDDLTHYARQEDLNAMERRLQVANEDNFRDLDGKRSVSIGNLHEQLTETKDDLGKQINAANVSIGGLKATVDMMEKQNAAADQKLTAILQRLPQRSQSRP